MDVSHLSKENTICELIRKLKETKLTKEQIELVNAIDKQANSMEDRLLKYCNSIEDLGFNRIGRDYGCQ